MYRKDETQYLIAMADDIIEQGRPTFKFSQAKLLVNYGGIIYYIYLIIHRWYR